MLRALALVLFLAAPGWAQDLGETTFPNSGAGAAQEPFLRGVLLLHSFEYDDAREAFQEALEVDPGFAMAAWGEAMTHNHPIWMRQDRDAGRAALEGADLSGTTDRERAYLATLEVLFGDGDDREVGAAKEDRDDAYAASMADLAAAYPDDLDAQSLYALALLGTAHEGRDFATYMRAAAVLEDVFARAPRHPGAAHYLIHAYDDPVHAPLGLRPARVYADVAPAASHALHMPSHIYLALGMWPETAEMNERSYLAAKANTDRRGEPLNGHGWHALWWWHYAETQRGDAAEADRLYRLALEVAGDDPDPTALAHVQRMRAQQSVAFDDYEVLDLEADDRAPDNVQDGLVNGLFRVAYTDAGTHRRALDDLRALAGDDPSWSDRAAVLVLEGHVLEAEGDLEAAERAFLQAAAVEAEAPLTFGPPSPALMANEALGFFLMGQNRPVEAAAAFQAALARAPGRAQASAHLTGLRLRNPDLFRAAQ